MPEDSSYVWFHMNIGKAYSFLMSERQLRTTDYNILAYNTQHAMLYLCTVYTKPIIHTYILLILAEYPAFGLRFDPVLYQPPFGWVGTKQGRISIKR